MERQQTINPVEDGEKGSMIPDNGPHIDSVTGPAYAVTRARSP